MLATMDTCFLTTVGPFLLHTHFTSQSELEMWRCFGRQMDLYTSAIFIFALVPQSMWVFHAPKIFKTSCKSMELHMDGNEYQTANQITAHNAGWRTQFRFRGSRHQPGVCEFCRSEEECK
jgi:hypothetical protein